MVDQDLHVGLVYQSLLDGGTARSGSDEYLKFAVFQDGRTIG